MFICIKMIIPKGSKCVNVITNSYLWKNTIVTYAIKIISFIEALDL